jgi:hypothetical protein
MRRIASVSAVAMFTSITLLGNGHAGTHVFITGCIERSAELPVGTSGTQPPATTEYTLTRVAPATTVAPAKAPKGYTSPSERLIAPAYPLGQHRGSLEPLLHQRVEVSGRLETVTLPDGARSSQLLQIGSFKLVSPSCN